MTAKLVLWASLACAALVLSGTSFAMAGTTGSGVHKDTLTTLNAPDYGGVFASGNCKGKVTVESLTPIEPGKNKQSAKQGGHPRPPGS